MTNLSNQDTNNNDDFVAGDFVVISTYEGYKDILVEIKVVMKKGLLYTFDHKTKQHHYLDKLEVRHATTAEKIAKRRLPAPVTLFISPQVEFYQPPQSEQVAILDMGEVSNLSCHISPLCRVLNKAYMTDVINHLVRAHKAQQEVS